MITCFGVDGAEAFRCEKAGRNIFIAVICKASAYLVYGIFTDEAVVHSLNFFAHIVTVHIKGTYAIRLKRIRNGGFAVGGNAQSGINGFVIAVIENPAIAGNLGLLALINSVITADFPELINKSGFPLREQIVITGDFLSVAFKVQSVISGMGICKLIAFGLPHDSRFGELVFFKSAGVVTVDNFVVDLCDVIEVCCVVTGTQPFCRGSKGAEYQNNSNDCCCHSFFLHNVCLLKK